MVVHIYKLIDLDDPETTRYVGKTKNPISKRRVEHSSEAKRGGNSRKNKWIRSVLKKGGKIEIILIEDTTEESWEEREIFWIGFHKSDKLTNELEGGESGGKGGSPIKYSMSMEDCMKWLKENYPHVDSQSKFNKIKNEFPDFITKDPGSTYAHRGWKGWGYFLGTNRDNPNNVDYILLEEAKIWIQNNTNGINSKKQWREFKKQNPQVKIPTRADRYYLKLNRGWISWEDFLGFTKKRSSKRKYFIYNESKNYAQKNLNYIKTSTQWREAAKRNEIPDRIPKKPDRYYEKWEGFPIFLNNKENSKYNSKKSYII